LPEGLDSISLFFSTASGCTEEQQQQHIAALSLSLAPTPTVPHAVNPHNAPAKCF